MNKYDFGTEQNSSGTAWKAWFKDIRSGKNNVIVKDGIPLLYNSELEALKAASRFFLEFINRSELAAPKFGKSAKAKAEELFKKKEIVK